ncbi:hypothetical protein [Cetobacterium sp.]|uniref:hypothetical protein n=1 Tax=Cetobacterium sp. TaxID=2071632 RepID=UPI003AF15D8D
MKKILLLGMLLTSSVLIFGAEEPDDAPLSKSDSFLVAFGMKDSPVVGQNTPAAATVAHSSAHASSTSLTSIQNTPYRNK